MSEADPSPAAVPTLPVVRIATRRSALALTQTRQTRDALLAALGIRADADRAAPLLEVVTTGDRIQDRRLREAGGKTLFTKEIEAALLDHRADLAVHSMKDMPADQPPGLAICAVPVREDARDALVSTRYGSVEALPRGARVGTASLRRQAQLLNLRPDLEVGLLRGNVDTRLRRLEAGEFEAIILAAAGLRRLGLEARITALLDPEVFVPAPGQGALALQCRTSDAAQDWAGALDHDATALCVAAERGAMRALEGSCRTAIGAHGVIEEGVLHLTVEALNPDGAMRWRRRARMDVPSRDQAEAMGLELGEAVRRDAGNDLVLA
jgi:hydroxymethylbilane synthase